MEYGMTTNPNRDIASANPILETRDLCKYFTVKTGGRKATLDAVDHAGLKIYPGKTLGLVGESGSGKSTIGFTIMQLHEPTSGEILYEGKQMAGLKGKALLASMPGLEKKDARVRLVGEIGSPIDPSPGCRLASRCPVAGEECFNVNPELKEISPGHAVACINVGIHRKAEPLTLSQITTTGDRLP